jgi:alpha-glucosidase
MTITRFIIFVFLLANTRQKVSAQEYFLYSPDSKLTMKISVTDVVKYAVSVSGKTIMSPSMIGCTTDFLQNMPLKVLTNKKGIVKNQAIYPIVKQKNRVVYDNYNWLSITFSDQNVALTIMV